MTAGVIGLFIFSGIILLVPSEVLAWDPPAGTHVWAAAAPGNANVAGNWLPAEVPTTGDNIIFNATSTYSCTWNLPGSFGDFTVATGYSGTVTLANGITVDDMTVQAGTLNAVSYTIYVDEDWYVTATYTYGTSKVVMNTAGSTMTPKASTLGFYNLKFNASGSYNIAETLYLYYGGTLEGVSGVILYLADCSVDIYSKLAVSPFTGYGTIQGDRSSNIILHMSATEDPTNINQANWDVETDFIITQSGVGTTTATVSGNISTSKSLIVQGYSDATRPINLGFNDVYIDCLDFLVERGQGVSIAFGASELTLGRAFDAGTGTIDYDTATLNYLSNTDTSYASLSGGAWCWFNRPLAVEYNDATYYGYVDHRGSIIIAKFDHATNLLDTHTLHYALQNDDHNAPGILVRDDGHILATWSSHGGNIIYSAISTEAEDISEWTFANALTGGQYSYPCPYSLSSESDKIYLIFREDWAYCSNLSYATSTDGGATWSAETVMVDNGDDGVYFVSASNYDDTLYFSVTDLASLEYKDIYYFEYSDGAFRTADGTSIGTPGTLPLSISDLELVYNSSAVGQYDAYVQDVSAISGNPVMG